MARSKKENKEMLQQAYFTVIKTYDIDVHAPINEQVHAMIEHADALQDDICKKADFIKIDAYQIVKEQYEELGIPKSVWLELVHVRRLQRHTTLTDDFIAKIAASFDGAKNVTALRMSMIDAIEHNNISNVSIPTVSSAKTFTYDDGKPLPSDFIELLDECADVRHEIDSRLWTQMRLLGEAFCHLTGEPYKVFKNLLDLWHYRNGGWPKETTPPRIWSAIARFINAYDMLDKYGFDMAKNWCKRFGLETKRTLPSPTLYKFDKAGENFGKYTMYKLKPDTEHNYPGFEFKPYHHLIISPNGLGFAYVWDTREIEFMFDSNILNVIDVTTDYVDSCQPLVCNEHPELEHDAKVQIPYAMEVIETDFTDGGKTEVIIGEPTDTTVQTPEERKADIQSSILDSTDNSELANAAMQSDKLERYEWLRQHPEHNFDENYSVQWNNGDTCEHQSLGRGYVVGANEETGELICHFITINQDLPVWAWHMTKIEQHADTK